MHLNCWSSPAVGVKDGPQTEGKREQKDMHRSFKPIAALQTKPIFMLHALPRKWWEVCIMQDFTKILKRKLHGLEVNPLALTVSHNPYSTAPHDISTPFRLSGCKSYPPLTSFCSICPSTVPISPALSARQRLCGLWEEFSGRGLSIIRRGNLIAQNH